jgi:hypothetical protein
VPFLHSKYRCLPVGLSCSGPTLYGNVIMDITIFEFLRLLLLVILMVSPNIQMSILVIELDGLI